MIFFFVPAAADPFTVGILDPYTSGLFACGGYKRLLVTYHGPLVNLRRSSDGATSDFSGTGITGTLDEAAVLAWAGGSTVTVARVYDQSGAGNHFDAPSTTSQPRVATGGVADGFIRFDGTDDIITCINNAAAVYDKAVVYRRQVRTYTGVGWIYGDSTNPWTGKHLAQQLLLNGTNYLIAPTTSPNYTFLGLTTFTGFATTMATDMVVFKPQSGNARACMNWYYGGSSLNFIADSFGDSGAGAGNANFSLDKWSVGNYLDLSQSAAMNTAWFAMYDTDQSANLAAMSALV